MTIRIAAAALLAALSLAACGDDDTRSPATTPTTSTPRPAELDNALWPDPARATKQAGPVEVARSFVEDFVGYDDPPLGPFAQGDSRSGEVQVFQRAENGEVQRDHVVSTISLRQLDGVRWFVITAVSDAVRIATPAAGEAEVMPAIASPVRVAGAARGFEGAILVRLFGAFDPKPLVEQGAQAGATSIEPFSTTLRFERPPAATGAIVVSDVGAVPGPKPFSAIPVRFADR